MKNTKWMIFLGGLFLYCLIPNHASATQAGDWFTRARALYILPMDSSGTISTIPTASVSVHPAWTGEIDIGYMFSKYVGSELILATCNNSLWGKGSLAGVKIGSSWLLPPTLLLQWRFFPSKVVQPYIGGGVNYTLFYGVDCSLPGTSLSLKHSWGPAVQGGMDFFFTSNWFINADIKYIWMKTHAILSGTTAGSVTVHINPILFGLGIGRSW